MRCFRSRHLFRRIRKQVFNVKITQVEFVISAVKPHQYPDDALPEFALAGRSNVGKSSLINRMIQRKGLARTSSSPGKTQQLNYYRVNDRMYLVDFPGYGYAKVSKVQRHSSENDRDLSGDREPLKMVYRLSISAILLLKMIFLCMTG